MNFKDLENAVIGETILVGENGIERFFMGFIPNKNRIITFDTIDDLNSAMAVTWEEYDIKDWKIKQPENEINLKLEQQLKETQEKLNIAVELNKEMFRQLNKIETFSDEKAINSLISGYGYISAIIKNFKMFNESHLKTIQQEKVLTKIKEE